ncbi:MAG: biotin/lipoyl-containing protein [Candidatus Zipacnadales bacterium]
MGHLIRMQKWAENLDEVTVGEWLKQVGDPVAPGDPVAELITEKATFQYTPEEGGVLLAILAPENSTVPVGFVIGFIGEPGEMLPEGVEAENQRLLDAKKQEAKLNLEVAPLTSGSRESLVSRTIRATPPARRLARDHGVSLDEVLAWVGENRRITDRDVAAFLQDREEKCHGGS